MERSGVGLNGPATAITVVGSDVYAGGNFTDAGWYTDTDMIARWGGYSVNNWIYLPLLRR